MWQDGTLYTSIDILQTRITYLKQELRNVVKIACTNGTNTYKWILK